jgi:hypothetical protein
MANLGWIKFGVSADTGKFAKDMQSAAKKTESFGSSLKSLVGAYVGFEALKMGSEKLKEYVMGTIEGVSQTKILAERVGLSAESFAQLSYAARRAHVGQDEFAVSLEQMNKRLAEVAIEGTGPAGDALKRFGLNARQLVGMGTDQAFMRLLAMMEEIHNPAERAAVAMDLFGKSGQGMINLVARGGTEVAAMRAEASRLGIALNDIDAAKVEEADQAFIRLHEAGQGFANMLVTQISPYIVKVIDLYMEWGYSGAKSASFVSQGVDWVTTGLGYAVDGVNVLKGAFYGLRSAITEIFSFFAAGFDKMVEGITWLSNKIPGVAIENTGLYKTLSEELHRLAKEDFAAAGDAFNAIGKGGQTARRLVDDIQGGANKRATDEAAKNKSFNAAGAMHTKEDEPRFAGAADLGSKEAYSAIVRNRFQGAGETEQRRIASNTQRGADAAERSNALLAAIAGAAQGAMGIKPHMPGAI